MKKSTCNTAKTSADRLMRNVNGLSLNDTASGCGITVKCIREARDTKDGRRRFSVSGSSKRSVNRGGYTISKIRELVSK